MALEYQIDKLDGLDESTQKLYKKEGDKYVLDVAGVAPKSKVDEFRQTNVELLKKLEGYKDVDISKYKNLLDMDRKVREKELIDKGEIEAVIAERVKELKESHSNEKTQLSTQLEAQKRQLETLLVDNVIKSGAISVGILPEALEDIQLRARTIFSIENGVPTAKNAKGEPIYQKDDPTKPLTVDTWVKDLKKTAPHLFHGFNGSGASGGTGHGSNFSKLSPTDKIARGLEEGLK